MVFWRDEVREIGHRTLVRKIQYFSQTWKECISASKTCISLASFQVLQRISEENNQRVALKFFCPAGPRSTHAIDSANAGKIDCQIPKKLNKLRSCPDAKETASVVRVLQRPAPAYIVGRYWARLTEKPIARVMSNKGRNKGIQWSSQLSGCPTDFNVNW